MKNDKLTALPLVTVVHLPILSNNFFALRIVHISRAEALIPTDTIRNGPSRNR